MYKTEPTPVKRATRHPAAGMGWMFLQEPEARLMASGPPQQHPDPNASGQNPVFTAWAIEQTRSFANQPIYKQQIEQQLTMLEQRLNRALADLNGAANYLDTVQEERAAVMALLPDGDVTDVGASEP